MGTAQSTPVYKCPVMGIECELFHESKDVKLKIGAMESVRLMKSKKIDFKEIERDENTPFKSSKVFLVQGSESSVFVFFALAMFYQEVSGGKITYPKGVTPIESGDAKIVVFYIGVPFTVSDKVTHIMDRYVCLSNERACFLSNDRKLEDFFCYERNFSLYPSNNENLVVIHDHIENRVYLCDRRYSQQIELIIDPSIHYCRIYDDAVTIISDSPPSPKRQRT